jgi:tRNA1(Val) A37 N6-methylase TrmN6
MKINKIDWANMQTTLDGLLNHRITLEQAVSGYRVAMDTVFLAAAVPAESGHIILDFGCGVGGVMLCLARRVPGIRATGIDCQSDLVELCQKNIKFNGFERSMDVINKDVTSLSDDYDSQFDHVAMNPPYHEEEYHTVSTHQGKRKAHSEKAGDLTKWIQNGAKALKNLGTLTLIHRADRLNDILQIMDESFGTIQIVSLLPAGGTPAKRVIVRGIKGRKGAVILYQNVILHKHEGGYTDEAEAILRHMQPLKFVLAEAR